MSQLTLLHGARQLLTLRGPQAARRGPALLDLGIIPDGSILLENGLIHSVGPTRRLENLKIARTATSIDVSGCVVMPGLIDPDVNFTLGELGSSGINIRRVSALQDSGAALLRSCLQHGTVSALLNVTAETGNPLADVCLLRQLSKITSGSVDVVRNWSVTGHPGSSDAMATWQTTLQAMISKRLLDSVTVVCARDTSAQPDWLSAIRATGLPVSLKLVPGDPNALAAALARIRPLSLRCPSALPPGHLELLLRENVLTVFAPGTELGQPAGTALRQLVDAGGALALSSGYHPVDSPGFSMQMAISLAIVHGQLTPEEAISAATVNAAYAMGRGDVTGTLEVGKRADLLVLSVPHYRDIARQFGINHVATVLRGGNVVYNRGRWKILANETSPGRVRSQSVGRS